jgi:hypothetical protein
MDHHVTGPIGNHLDIAFINCISVLGSNSGEGPRLILGDAILTKNACIVDPIIAVVVFDSHTSKIPTHLFKLGLAHDSLACSHACLPFNIDKIGGSVSVNGISMKATFRSFTSISIQATSWRVNNKLVREDFVAWFVLFELEDAIFFRNGARSLDMCGIKLLSRKSTCKTTWDQTRVSSGVLCEKNWRKNQIVRIWDFVVAITHQFSNMMQINA